MSIIVIIIIIIIIYKQSSHNLSVSRTITFSFRLASLVIEFLASHWLGESRDTIPGRSLARRVT